MEPFSNQKLVRALRSESQQSSTSAALLAPELSRRKEPLESYPLDSMTMVGSLVKQGQPVVLLDNDNTLSTGSRAICFAKRTLEIFDRPRLKASVVGGSKEKAGVELSSLKPRSFRQGFDFLPGNLELYRLEMAPGEGRENRLKSYIKAIDAENHYDFVIIDTPPTPSVWMTSALIASDYYLIPVRPDPLSLTGVDLLKGIVSDRKENFGLDIECLGLVLTMVRQGTVVLADAERALRADSYWKDRLFGARIPGRVKVAEYQLNNQFMLDMDDSDTKLAITTLTNQILAKLEAP